MRCALAVALLFVIPTSLSAQSTTQCQFENIRAPLSDKVYDTAIYGINRSQTIVGMYTVLKKVEGYWEPFAHGFMRSKGKYYPIDVPGAAQTEVFALNDVGQIVGESWPAYYGAPKPFLLDANGYHELSFPGYYDVFEYGLNNRGDIVGTFVPNGSTIEKGFRLRNGNLQIIVFPGANGSQVRGTNDLGDIVGDYGTADGAYHGLVLSKGVWRTIDYPGARWTFLRAVNDKGVAVGSYLIFSQPNVVKETGSFRWKEGIITKLPSDGSYDCRKGKTCPNQTNFVGLNDDGQFVGDFFPGRLGYAEGFLATCK